jgi:predicted RNase H-like nuclease (RuvC/YqgF family)
MKAEQQYKEAFERLKAGNPMVLPKGSAVTQNNVAREAGTDPSALRKSRFPTLVAEIQRYASTQAPVAEPSKRQSQSAQRQKTKSLKERIAEISAQRDHLASILLEADATILELRSQLNSIQSSVAEHKVVNLKGRKL